LKVDLEEVIALTCDLIKTQLLELKSTEGLAGSSIVEEDVTAKLLAAERPQPEEPYAKRDWKIGDKCLAIWSDDGQ
jgi:hypothetical protein